MSALIDEFIQFSEHAEKQFGENVVVLMQVGKFMECYEHRPEDQYQNAFTKKADLLNLSKMRLKYPDQIISKKNYMAFGFPNVVTEKYINIICKNNMTVCIVLQDNNGSDKKQPIKRYLDKIYSPSTQIDCSSSTKSDNLYLMSILTEFYDVKLIDCAITYVDLSIGKPFCVDIDFTCDMTNEEKFGIINKQIELINPKEIIVNTIDYFSTSEDLLETLKFQNCLTHIFINQIEKLILKASWRENYLTKMFNSSGINSTSSLLGLEKHPNLTISLIIMLQFAYKHDTKIVEKLQIPKIISLAHQIKLSENCVKQLNLIDGKFSVMSILDKTKTSMGYRILHHNLLHPMIDADQMKSSYSNIKIMLHNKIFIKFQEKLAGIRDLEKLNRKLSLAKIEPYEWTDFSFSYHKIIEIANMFDSDVDKIPESSNLFKKGDLIDSLKRFIIDYTTKLDLTTLNKLSFKTGFIKKNIFHKTIYDELDQINDKISILESDLQNFKKTVPFDANIEETQGEGLYFQVSIKKYDQIKTDKFFKNLKSKKLTNYYKIYHPFLDETFQKLTSLQNQLTEASKKKFEQLQQFYHDQYGQVLYDICNWVGQLDYFCSAAYLACFHNFNEPQACDDSSSVSFIQFQNGRHPLIEQINKQIKYVENDLCLSEDLQGILLFGQNFSGKSSFIKMVAIITIIAQCGLYVPAENMKFKPFKSIITKIALSDDIFQGESTFTAEIKELKYMIDQSNANTLIIADELCSSSEYQSAISLVAATILQLNKNKCSFIFTTHFHELLDINEVRDLKNVKPYQMKVDFENGNIIFCRKLVSGQCERLYGLELAKHMNLNQEVLKNSFNIRERFKPITIQTENDDLYSIKPSRYNKDVYMDHCYICQQKQDLHCHHIVFQQDFNKSDTKLKSFDKNAEHNLCILCETCHIKLHQKKIYVYGYLATAKGPLLKWSTLSDQKA